MSTSGRKLLSSLIASGDVNAFLKMGLEPYLFKDGEVILFEFISSHLGKYGKLPSPETVEATAGLADSLVQCGEPPKFYLDEVEKRYLHNLLKGGVNEAAALLTNHSQDEALAALTKIVMEQYKRKNRRHITDFRDAANIVYKAYVAQKSATSAVGLPFGWDSLDEMSGGARAGDFISFVGRPMMGKTFKMLYTSHVAWKKANRRPLFVSMEMMATILQQRLAAIDTKTHLTQLMKAELSSKAFNAMMGNLTELKNMAKPFWIVDNNVVKTVDDLVMQCQILQPDCVWVDAAYLLKHPNSKIGKWDRQSENAEAMKERIATDFELPLICSYQLSKESAKNKKKNKDEKASMEDIYGADAIAQISSIILGLFDFENDIEAAKKRRVQILKGRSGETGEFLINWDFSSKMDFTEFKPEAVADMQLGHLG
jgi:replicative DNA helicase